VVLAAIFQVRVDDILILEGKKPVKRGD